MGITPAIIGAVASVGSTVGALTSGNSQADAANNAAAANQQAGQNQLAMYNQTRADLLPYSQAGQTAFGNLSSLLGQNGQANSAGMLSALQNYPGYQFALQQGNQSLDRSAAAKGLLLSGGQAKDLTNYNQGMATQLFGNYFNQNLSAAQLGESAASMTGNAGSAAANGFNSATAQAGNAMQNAGAASASGITGATNGLFGNGGVLQNAFQAYNAQQYGALPAGYSSGVNVTPGINLGGYGAGSGFDGSEPF